MASQPSLLTREVPRHIAVIMDGNGRWAKKRKLPRVAGHRKGSDAVRRCIEACADEGVAHLTLYAFSSENWTRPKDEVADLMHLLRVYLRKEVSELHRRNIRVRFIGSRDRLSQETLQLMENAEALTQGNCGLNVHIALNYGAHSEIALAARTLAQAAVDGKIQAHEISEEMLGQALLTHDVPDPDMIIRTSGEKRLSNFMLWQAAYAELVFLDVLWPDFDADALKAALEEYFARNRRFGGR
ncbi:MAG: isoprenyl transferase [Pseudomonadota bacterium]